MVRISFGTLSHRTPALNGASKSHSLLVLLLLMVMAGCSGPTFVFAGGALAGEVAPFETQLAPSESGVIQLETRPADPYSVNVNMFVIDGAVYVDPAAERRWYQHMAENDLVRVKFAGSDAVYTARAYPETDPAVLAQFETGRKVMRIGPR